MTSNFDGKLLPVPIFRVVLLASVRAPPKSPRLAVKVERSRVPAETFRFPLTIRLPASVAVLLDLSMVKLLKLVAAMD